MTSTRLPAHLERAVAVAAKRDPRTIRRYLAGQRVRGVAADAIAAALRELHIDIANSTDAEKHGGRQ